MSSSKKATQKTVVPPIEKTRDEAIQMLEDMREQLLGLIFSIFFNARGDGNSLPHACRKVVRFRVTQHLKGGRTGSSEREHDREQKRERDLIGVYEMCTRKSALKRYRQEALDRISELTVQIAIATMTAEQASGALKDAQLVQGEAEAALHEFEHKSFGTPKARQACEGPRRKTLRSANTALKNARVASEQAASKVAQLNEKFAQESLKLTNPREALSGEINRRIAKLEAQLAAAASSDEYVFLENKLVKERELLADPVKSLLGTYRSINLRGLRELKIRGQVYRVTTPPEPFIPGEK